MKEILTRPLKQHNSAGSCVAPFQYAAYVPHHGVQHLLRRAVRTIGRSRQHSNTHTSVYSGLRDASHLAHHVTTRFVRPPASFKPSASNRSLPAEICNRMFNSKIDSVLDIRHPSVPGHRKLRVLRGHNRRLRSRGRATTLLVSLNIDCVGRQPACRQHANRSYQTPTIPQSNQLSSVQ